MAGLRELPSAYPIVGDVRGKGLMIGIELVEPETRRPNPKAAAAVMEQAKAQGLLIGKGGLYGNVLRIAPPLSLTLEEAAEGLDTLVKSIDAVSSSVTS
jgi:4-aminobutyrate aminotransferase